MAYARRGTPFGQICIWTQEILIQLFFPMYVRQQNNK